MDAIKQIDIDFPKQINSLCSQMILQITGRVTVIFSNTERFEYIALLKMMLSLFAANFPHIAGINISIT